jgi:hypothetical protein
VHRFRACRGHGLSVVVVPRHNAKPGPGPAPAGRQLSACLHDQASGGQPCRPRALA